MSSKEYKILSFKLKKPAAYFVSLLLIIILFEVFLNFTPFIFSNLTDRVRLKSAMFDFRKKTEVLFLGSSRFKDAISPSIFTDNINNSLKTNWSGFNGAITGANINRLNYFFDKALKKDGVKMVVIEMSLPQLTNNRPDADTEVANTDFEGRLQEAVSDKVKLIEWRKSFRLENITNAPAILAADHLEGSELYRSNALKEFLADNEYEIKPEELSHWVPNIIQPLPYSSNNDNEFVATFSELAKKAEEAGIKLLFVVPPLVNKSKDTETQQDVIGLFQQIANNTKVSIVDYSHINISEDLFRDKDSHLNGRGRFIFSTVLSTKLLTTVKRINQ